MCFIATKPCLRRRTGLNVGLHVVKGTQLALGEGWHFTVTACWKIFPAKSTHNGGHWQRNDNLDLLTVINMQNASSAAWWVQAYGSARPSSDARYTASKYRDICACGSPVGRHTACFEMCSDVNKTRAYYVGGRRQTASTWRLGGFSFTWGDFTKIILMRATVVRPKSGENK